MGVFTRGSGLQKKDLCEAGVPAIHYGQIYTYYKASVEKTLSYVTEEVASKLRKVDYGDVIITNTSENIDDVCKALLYLVEEQGVIGGHACTFRPSNQLLGKYLVYYTMTDEFYQQKRKLAKGTKVIDVSTTDLAKVVIPLPPLSVQAEIVRILDSFTSLTAELEAELEARRAQYAHYRDELLKFTNRGGGGKIVYRSLGEVAAIRRGDRVTKSQLTANGAYPVVSGGTKPLGYFSQCNRKAETITIAQYGTAGYVDWQEKDFWANDVCYSVFPHQEIDNRFLLHVLRARQGEIYSLATDAIPAHLPKHRIEGLPIPIPPLEEQERIVRLLDEFDTLTCSLTEGLPREIELRRQQYAYYRDQLLSFDEYSTSIRTRTVGGEDRK